MLDDYKENKFYDYAKNLKKYYHAYLFEVDSYDIYPLILGFAKMIICKNHYTNYQLCQNCNICNLINNNYYEDLKLLELDGISIKKEQIQNLQKQLSLKSVNDNNQVYIIKEADKMNLSASNSLLKFIEEPQEGIYGILVTTNKKQILPTILSRTCVINLKSKEKEEFSKEEIENVMNFFSFFHSRKEETLPYLKKEYFAKYPNKEGVLKSFHLMEVVLDALINMNYQTSNNYMYSIYDIIKDKLKDISLDDLIFYLEKIIKFKNKLITIPNLNLNLFMDRFIIEMSKVR